MGRFHIRLYIGFHIGLYLLLLVVPNTSLQQRNAAEKKGKIASSDELSSLYNKEWQNVLTKYLIDNTASTGEGAPTVKTKRYVVEKYLKRASNGSADLLDVSNNILIDVDNSKKSNISHHENVKKNVVLRSNDYKLNTRQTIDSPMENYDTNVGKPYGDPDNYQAIGDGVYLMNNEGTGSNKNELTAKTKIKTIKENLPDTTKTLTTILGNLDREDKDILDETKKRHEGTQPVAIESSTTYSLEGSNIQSNSQQEKVLSSENNIEGVEPKEMNLITDIQRNLKADDTKADQKINAEAEAIHRTNSIDFETGKKGLETIAKAVQDTDKDFIKNNPLAIDPDDKKDSTDEESEMYKKDLTIKSADTAKLLEKVDAADNQIKKFAGRNDLIFNSNDVLDSERAKNIADFATQEDAQIMVGGSRSRRPKRHKKKRRRGRHNTRKKRLWRTGSQHSSRDDINEEEMRKLVSFKDKDRYQPLTDDNSADTGFFMTDENNLASLNKKTEDFVSHTVNASLVDIIEASDDDIASKRRNVTNTSIQDALDSLNPTEPLVAGNRTESNHLRKGHKHSIDSNSGLQKIDMNLYNVLNKTSDKRHDHHQLGSVWKVVKKPSKIISVGGKPGVQIDLYITNNKKKRSKKKDNFHKRNTPKTDMQIIGNKNFIGSKGEEDEDTTNLSNDVEDVSLKEAANHQEKQMFSSNLNNNEFGSDKTSIEDIQTDHVEGNEEKQNNDINLQDAINSEELNNAIKQSDLKGLSEMKSEIDLQDEKNTVDFFNQPSTAKSFSHHLDISPNMRELTQQIKEAEAGAENESSKARSEEDPQKVKIILHIPEAISKQKQRDKNTQEAIESLTEQAKAFLSPDRTTNIMNEHTIKKGKDTTDDATLEAAKKIEEFIKQEASREVAEDKKQHASEVGNTSTKLKDQKGEEASEDILNALLKSSSTLKDLASSSTTNLEDDNTNNEDESAKTKEYKENDLTNTEINDNKGKETAKALETLNGLKENDKSQSILSFANTLNPHPTMATIEKFIKTTHDQALRKELLKSSEAVFGSFTDAEISSPTTVQQLRINGGKVLGGNVRGGSILGGVVSGGDVSGGEIRGGRIEGGNFKNGLLIDGVIENGTITGGRIKGGKILGGEIKSGMIDGGVVKGGLIEGGHLIEGSVEGGDFKGGEISGGHLLSGEMDGGILKNGTINGGVLKGGIIESGTLEGGVMFSGILRGGDVKSGIIRGGIIDKGVIVQDAEIGPGVEIHDGVVKGGKITVNSIPQITGAQSSMLTNSLVPEAVHTDENRSNIMYTLEVLPKPIPKEEFNATVFNSSSSQQKDEPIKVITNLAPAEDATNGVNNMDKEKLLLEKSLSEMNNGIEIEDHLKDIAKPKNIINDTVHSVTKEASKLNETVSTHTKQATPTAQQVESPHIKHLIGVPKHKHMEVRKQKPTNNHAIANANARHIVDNKSMQTLLSQLQTSGQRKSPEDFRNKVASTMYAQLEQRKTEQARLMEDVPLAHWELSKSNNNIIKGDPGVKLRISGGVRIHNGHALLDGMNGYMDAGDYQGECFSDPEVCQNGFTIQMTLKIYRDSVFNTSRMFLIDSGAWSKDSRGISVYVSDGRIGGIVVTRDETWCLHKILEPFIEKWMTLTITWDKNKGLYLYINCDEFDKSTPHASSECDQCTDKNGCHRTDVATRLMFGRPNKGPHFKVIHMAVGEISLYERYFDKNDVKRICGSKDDVSATSAVASIIQLPSPQPAAIVQAAIAEPSPVQQAPGVSFSKQDHSNDEDRTFLYPTPPVMKLKKFHETKQDEERENLWPTPAHLRPMFQPKPTEKHKSLIDYNTDRRSSLWTKRNDKLNGGYSPWTGWSPCSQSCGDGVKIAVRYCSNPTPKKGGKDCSMLGSPRKFTPCSNSPCSVIGNRRGTIPIMRLEYGTKKSEVPPNVQSPMIIVNGQQQSLQELETAFEQLKHRRK